MIARVLSKGFAVIFVVAGLLFCQPGKAQAQELLPGHWVAAAPQGVNTSYTFGLAEYVTLNTWRGSYTLYWGNYPISCGRYELRMVTGAMGTLGLRDGFDIATRVASIDLGARTMTYMGVTYHP